MKQALMVEILLQSDVSHKAKTDRVCLDLLTNIRYWYNTKTISKYILSFWRVITEYCTVQMYENEDDGGWINEHDPN